MTAFQRHLTAAAGYLELGMAADAGAELDAIEPARRDEWQVLALRVAVCQETAAWEPMRRASEQLVALRPDEPQWPITLAYATRRSRSLTEARAILLAALERHPEESTIPYNLACYEAQLDRLAAARQWLNTAIALNAHHREMALADSDLTAFHEALRGGEF